MILKGKGFDLKAESPGTKRCNPLLNNNRAKRKVRPCNPCPMLSEIETTTLNLPEVNCKSCNIVNCSQFYLCNKQYTEKSSNKLETIITGHRYPVGYSDDNCINEKTLVEHLQEVRHFVSVDQFNSNYSFTILEVSPRNLDQL